MTPTTNRHQLEPAKKKVEEKRNEIGPQQNFAWNIVTMAPPTPPLIKGFLPVRLKLPSLSYLMKASGVARVDVDEEDDETFFFVKPHVGGTADENKTQSAASSKTLFVVNVPVIPGIRTKILLKSLLGRFGDVERVTVVENPRNKSSIAGTKRNDARTTSYGSNFCYSESVVVPSAWSKSLDHPTLLPPILAEGKFAHVEFTSVKEMKRAMKALTDIMVELPPRANDEDNNDIDQKSLAIHLDKLEFQTLMDETQRQYQNHLSDNNSGEIANDDGNDRGDSSSSKLSGILAVAERYRASYRHVMSNRGALLEACNAVVTSFEEAEQSKQRERELAAHMPDDDGFVTVSYSNNVGNQQELETSKTTSTGRKAGKRHRTKKESIGSSQLQDFYRFQRKENRKRDLQDLRKKFEEDLAKVKRMKEEHQYRPFK